MATENSNSVELIEFIRPCGNANNLYIRNISKDLSEDDAQVFDVFCKIRFRHKKIHKNVMFLQHKLHKIFSKFGLLYEVQVVDSKENITGL